MTRFVEFPTIHTNDYHAQVRSYKKRGELVGGAAYRAGVMKTLANGFKTPPLLADLGDFSHGTLASKFTGGLVVIQEMNQEGYGYAVLGNHDFEFGLAALERMSRTANFPFLAANVRNDYGKPFPWIKPYIIHQVTPEIKVAHIGIATRESMRHLPKDERGLISFLEPEAVLRPLINVLQGRVNLITLGSHLGLNADFEMAKKFPEIRKIHGAHSHHVLKNGKMINGTLITQGGHRGEWVGLSLDIFDRWGRYLESKDDLHRVVADNHEILPDEKVYKIVQGAISQEERAYEQEIGYTQIPLKIGFKETTNFLEILADAIQAATGVPYAVVASNTLVRGIEDDLSITRGKLYDALPWDEQLVSVNLSGRALRRALEYSYRDRSNAILVPAGFSYQYDSSAPQWNRVPKTFMNGKPLDYSPTNSYEIAMSEFEFESNPNFREEGTVRQKFGMLRDAIEAYITEQYFLDREGPDGRIIKAA